MDMLIPWVLGGLRHHQGHPSHDDAYGLGNVPVVCHADLHRRGFHLLLCKLRLPNHSSTVANPGCQFPEFKGRSIESMDDLFQNSIWTMWRHAYPTEEEKVRVDIQAQTVKEADEEEKQLEQKKAETSAFHAENRAV